MSRPVAFTRLVALLCVAVLAFTTVGFDTGAVAARAAQAKPVLTKVGSGAGPLAPTTVVLQGRNLKRSDTVMFGRAKARILKRTATRVTVRTPAAARAGSVSVRIHTPQGWTARTAAARYTFVGAPVLNQLNPASGAYTGGQRVAISGRELARVSTVLFGGQAAKVVQRSASQIVVEAPIGTLGQVDVRAVSLGGTSRPIGYTYVGSTTRQEKTIETVDATYTAAAVDWVTGGYDSETEAYADWVVSLPAGSSEPTVGQPFLVAPGSINYPSGLTGTVVSIATQTDESLRVTVAPSDAEAAFDRFSVGYSGSVDLDAGQGPDNARVSRPGRRAAESAIEWPIGGSSMYCRDQQGNSVAFGANFTMRVSDVDVSQDFDMGGFFSKPTYDGTFTAEVKTVGTFHGEVASTCSTSTAWQNANRRTIPLGTTGLTISFAPTFEFSVSAKGTLTITDRTRTTYAISAKLGETPRFSRTSRTVESKVGGALTFGVTVAGGVAVQFGILDRVGVQGKVLLGLSGDVEAANQNVCLTVKVVLKLSVNLFFDALVVRWDSPSLTATIDLYQLLRRCVLAEQGEPTTDEPRITTTRLPDSVAGSPYSSYLSTDDGRSGTWSVTGFRLPAGLALDPLTGEISGTPTAQVGDYPVVVDFAGADGRHATSTVRIRVRPATGIGGGDIQVTLRWNGPADLDLHVVEPSGEEIYYSNSYSASGGQLDHDANAGCNGLEDDDNPVENVFWPTGTAPAGSYAARVVVYAECSGPLEWHLTVRRNGVVVVDQTGTGGSDAIPFDLGLGNRPSASNAALAGRFAQAPYPPK